MQFLIDLKLLSSSSLALTTTVLGATDYDTTMFRMNLNSSDYILVAAATWAVCLPLYWHDDQQTIGGRYLLNLLEIVATIDQSKL